MNQIKNKNTIVLSVLRFKASDYLFGILNFSYLISADIEFRYIIDNHRINY